MIFKHIRAFDPISKSVYKITHLDSDTITVIKSEIKENNIVVDTIEETVPRKYFTLITLTEHLDDTGRIIWEEDSVIFGINQEKSGVVRWHKDPGAFYIEAEDGTYPLIEIDDQLIHIVGKNND